MTRSGREPWAQVLLWALVAAVGAWEPAGASIVGSALVQRDRSVPILGVTLDEGRPVGVVTAVDLRFEERADHGGLMVQFRSGGGKFSPKAQTSIEQGIYRAAKAAKLSPDSWTVRLALPSDVRLFGDSLAAMISLTVIACAKNDVIHEDRIITGGIDPEGHISKVGGLSLKIDAAKKANIRRVLVPDDYDPTEARWDTPFLMHVSPVNSIAQAYHELTGHPIN